MRIGTAVALRVHRRSLLYSALALVGIALIGTATLTLGSLGIPLTELPAALLGHAEGTAAFVLERLRGPRFLTAVLVGALLGISGSLFQTVTRNPLGSPDVIGLGAGAGAGVAIAALAVPGFPTPLGALVGGLAATALVYVSTGVGFRSPARVIIAGIGVAAMAFAVTQYIVSVELRDAASQLAGYLAGSLNASDATDVLTTSLALLVILPAALALSSGVGMIELGDGVATSVGTSVDRTRTLAILVAVAAAAAAVSAAGPIAFVALTAPQIAKRVTGSPGANVASSALTGALVLTLADLAAQQLPWADGLPVGILTAVVGGSYLGYLLVRTWSKGRP